MELLYCTQCGKKIPLGGADEGKRLVIDDAPVCPKCYAQRPEAQSTDGAPVETDPVPTRPRTSQSSIPAARRPSSRLMPAAVSERKSSRRLAVGRRSAAALWLSGAAGLLLAGAVAAVFYFRASESAPASGAPEVSTETPPDQVPGPGPAPSKLPPSSGAALDQARVYWQNHPEDYQEAIAKFEAAAKAAKGGQGVKPAEDGVAEVRAAREAAGGAVLADLRERAGQLTGAGDYDAAMALYDQPPSAKLAELLVPRLKTAREDLAREAVAKLQPALDNAERLSKDGQPEKGLAELDKVKSVKYATWNDKLVALRTRLGREAEDEAAKARNQQGAAARLRAEQVLERFETSALAGNRAYAAATLLSDKKDLDKDALAAMPKELEAAERVASKLTSLETERRQALKKLAGQEVTLRLRSGRSLKGKVEEVLEAGLRLRVTIRADGVEGRTFETVLFGDLAAGELVGLLPAPGLKDDDDRVAAALVLMADGDVEGAGQALKAAADHPLAARLAKSFAEAAKRAREAAAELFWNERIAKRIKEQYTDAEAGEVLAVLNAFTRDFGESEFAKTKAEAIGKFRPLVAFRPAAVQALFKGKVVRFDPATMEVELFWDFSNQNQLADFEATGKPAVAGGQLTLKPDEGLKFQNAFGSRLKVACSAACAGRSHVALWLRAPSESVALCRTVGNTANLWKNPSGLGSTKVAAGSIPLEAACIDGTYSATAGNKQVHKPIPLPGTPLSFGLTSHDATATVKNLRAYGPLDRAWLEKALAAKKPAPPAPGGQ